MPRIEVMNVSFSCLFLFPFSTSWPSLPSILHRMAYNLMCFGVSALSNASSHFLSSARPWPHSTVDTPTYCRFDQPPERLNDRCEQVDRIRGPQETPSLGWCPSLPSTSSASDDAIFEPLVHPLGLVAERRRVHKPDLRLVGHLSWLLSQTTPPVAMALRERHLSLVCSPRIQRRYATPATPQGRPGRTTKVDRSTGFLSCVHQAAQGGPGEQCERIRHEARMRRCPQTSTSSISSPSSPQTVATVEEYMPSPNHNRTPTVV